MRIFSGIQPTGNLHLGNYLGAIREHVALQDEEGAECIYCIVDLHALTGNQDPRALSNATFDAIAMYLATGLDPQKSTLFVQSHRSEHSELMWILSTLTTMGELGRMTQFKEKRGTTSEASTGLGLFAYPVLMAADILLYQTDVVPVGSDQTQHVELVRDIAKRFNHRYGEAFVVPELRVTKETARIMALDDPTVKMSKSAPSPSNYIALTDDEHAIERKIMKAVTDSGTAIEFSEKKPALRNLITIMSALTDETPSTVVERYHDRGYAEFKRDLAEVVIEHLRPLQGRFRDIRADEAGLRAIVRSGADRVGETAANTLADVTHRVGLVER